MSGGSSHQHESFLCMLQVTRRLQYSHQKERIYALLGFVCADFFPAVFSAPHERVCISFKAACTASLCWLPLQLDTRDGRTQALSILKSACSSHAPSACLFCGKLRHLRPRCDGRPGRDTRSWACRRHGAWYGVASAPMGDRRSGLSSSHCCTHTFRCLVQSRYA